MDDDAPPKVIKTAYRDLTRVCHPDLTGGKGHNICILLNEAYTVLMDNRGRQKYNALLELALKDAEDDYTGESCSCNASWQDSCSLGVLQASAAPCVLVYRNVHLKARACERCMRT